MEYQNQALRILEILSNAITKKYDPNGNKIFDFTFVGRITVNILSPDIAIMKVRMGKDNNTYVLYIMHPKFLNRYNKPLAAVKMMPYKKKYLKIKFFYSRRFKNSELTEIINLIKNTLDNMGEVWSQQSIWKK